MTGYPLIDNEAVSVIVPVSSLIYAGNVFINYMQQDLGKKELILVHNNPSDDFERWIYLSGLYPLTRIYQLDYGTSLGECLNYCAERTIFENIAIFREMHHYGQEYLSGSLGEMHLNSADLAGKKTYFSQCENGSHQTLVTPGFEKCFTDMVILPTFIFKHAIYKNIRFKDSNSNLDTGFCEDCRGYGYRIYSTDTGGFRFCEKQYNNIT